MTELTTPLTLPCGATLSNRIAKSAMTEGLATHDGRPTDELIRLYDLWADSGAGMLLSGNIQIDADHLERPGNVIIDRAPDQDMRDRLARYAKAATRGGAHFWAQIAHGGRQTQKIVNPAPKAPSAVPLGVGAGQFGTPVALELEEITDLINRFAAAAEACQAAGFTGVQIHAAHGYLISSFLNPRANKREDAYGGSLENRARFLLETVAAVRAAVGPAFPISVKLNSADFQKGGFSFEDSVTVAKMLEKAGVDLLEISGGNYEHPKMVGADGIDTQEEAVAPSTAAREAYFVDFAKIMRQEVAIPLMVTGGFRSRTAFDHALETGAVDVIGLARPYCVMTDAAHQILSGLERLPDPEKSLRLLPPWLGFLRAVQIFKTIDSFAVQFWFYGQLYALGRKGVIDPDLTPLSAYLEVDRTHKKLMKQRRQAG